MPSSHPFPLTPSICTTMTTFLPFFCVPLHHLSPPSSSLCFFFLLPSPSLLSLDLGMVTGLGLIVIDWLNCSQFEKSYKRTWADKSYTPSCSEANELRIHCFLFLSDDELQLILISHHGSLSSQVSHKMTITSFFSSSNIDKKKEKGFKVRPPLPLALPPLVTVT